MPTRRTFLAQSGLGLGSIALATLLQRETQSAENTLQPLQQRLPHFAPTAKRVIFLMQSGAPSQVDMFDYKPELAKRRGKEFPASVRGGQRLTTMTGAQKELLVAPPAFRFKQHGQAGMWLSELLPHTAKVANDLCFIRSMHTTAINHDPGVTYLQTGSEQPGRPSAGSWVDFGLGAESADLPAYVVFVSGGTPGDQPLFNRLWGNGFLPAEYQGVKMRAKGLLYLDNPPGIDSRVRRQMLSGIAALNQLQQQTVGDPAIEARTRSYQATARLQSAAPQVFDFSRETAATLAMYGSDVNTPGSFAANCLLARRMAQRGVRFIQLFHRGWDHHANLPHRIRQKCQQVDQPSAALVADLKQRGMLDDTLVIWAGEFGRTAFCQGELTATSYGRDHHPRCFTIWMAGGGVKAGAVIGSTDAFSYNIEETPVHIHDLQATMLHCLGLDHQRLTFRFRGRDYRLTDIAGNVVQQALA